MGVALILVERNWAQMPGPQMAQMSFKELTDRIR